MKRKENLDKKEISYADFFLENSFKYKIWE